MSMHNNISDYILNITHEKLSTMNEGWEFFSDFSSLVFLSLPHIKAASHANAVVMNDF